ncbi:MAG TPA: VOC family protein [Candidatus Rubrimentiphilum sp.]|nr:VOC family protein [Candidatus Rubrimentiphilum sp.]
MKLEPYIFFYGKCEEALAFYKKVLGGEYNVIPFGKAPHGHEVPADYQNKVMHADFKGQGFAFMASDGPPGKTVDPDAGNIALSLELSSAAEGKRVFDALADGGKVSMPLSDVEWGGGGKFGIIVDRFGTEWMVTSPQ